AMVQERSSMKVIYEPEIEMHPPDLYRSEVEPGKPVAGWGAFDETARAQYDREGYLVVQRALSPDLVGAARSELQAMTLADSPGCESICFEGRIRDRLRRDVPEENSASVEEGQFTLGCSDA